MFSAAPGVSSRASHTLVYPLSAAHGLYVTVNTVEVDLARVRQARRSLARSARQAAVRGPMSERGRQ